MYSNAQYFTNSNYDGDNENNRGSDTKQGGAGQDHRTKILWLQVPRLRSVDAVDGSRIEAILQKGSWVDVSGVIKQKGDKVKGLGRREYE